MRERTQASIKKLATKSENKTSRTQSTAHSQSISSPIDQIQFLQRTIGNQAVGRLLKSGALQAKLRIGQPGDIYEQEADQVAEQVMRMQVPRGMNVSNNIQNVQRKCPGCNKGIKIGKEDEEKLHKKEASGSTHEATSELESRISAIRGGGQPLDPASRAFYEPRFGADFSHVRIHTGAHAAESARALNAQAFTVRKDVVFASGQYQPESYASKKLLAHELTHVIQQSGGHSSGVNLLRRACGPQEIGITPENCDLESKPLGERRYLFNVNCDDFAPGEALRLQHDLALLPPGTSVSILGAASSDGDRRFNEALSCARARTAEAAIRTSPTAPTITSVKAVGPQGPSSDSTFRAISLEFRYPSPGSRFPPPGRPRIHMDQGSYFPVIPLDPVNAFAACQAIPPIAGAICGSAVTGLPCPAWFCTPFPTVAIARECRDKCSLVLLAGITGVVRDARVIPYWSLYLRGGASSQLNMSPVFGADFAAHIVSQHAAHYLTINLQTYLRRAATTLFVGPGPWTIDFSTVLAREIAHLETTGHPQVMEFAPASTIAGLFAGGVALTQSSCAAGLVPSSFDDHRSAKVVATVIRLPRGFLVIPRIEFRVEDTIDFCPGNCGTGAALLATVLLSRLEASGVSGDVPFLVDYTIQTPPFVV